MRDSRQGGGEGKSKKEVERKRPWLGSPIPLRAARCKSSLGPALYRNGGARLPCRDSLSSSDDRPIDCRRYFHLSALLDRRLMGITVIQFYDHSDSLILI